jgi:hypothetical protein
MFPSKEKRCPGPGGKDVGKDGRRLRKKVRDQVVVQMAAFFLYSGPRIRQLDKRAKKLRGGVKNRGCIPSKVAREALKRWL